MTGANGTDLSRERPRPHREGRMATPQTAPQRDSGPESLDQKCCSHRRTKRLHVALFNSPLRGYEKLETWNSLVRSGMGTDLF